MPILEKGKSPPSLVQCVREVRVGVPLERLDALQRFYTVTLGLDPWPAERQIPGGWGVGDPQCGLFLEFRHDPQVDPVRRRFTLLVGSLSVLEARLAEQQWPCERIRGFGFYDQYLLLHDPAGHLVEVRQTQAL